MTGKDVIEDVKAQLERKYELIVNNVYAATDKIFFVGIAEYVVFAADNEVLNAAITSTILKEKQDWVNKLESLGKQAEAEFDSVFQKVDDYLSDKKEARATVSNIIKEFQDVRSGHIRSSNGQVHAAYHKLYDLVYILSQDPKHTPFFKEFSTEDDQGQLHWHLSEAYTRYQSEEQRFKDDKEINVWGSWNELVVVFQSFFRKFEIIDELKNDDSRFFDSMNYHYLFRERDLMLGINKSGNTKQESHHFTRDEYKYHLWRVHNFLLDCLHSALRSPDNDQQKKDMTLQQATAIKGLFSLSKNPPAIRYEGKSKSSKEWKKPRGKTQTYAILLFAAEKYKRNKAMRTTNLVKLSLQEIEDRLNEPVYCNKPLKWESAPTAARKLNRVRRNIQETVPFADNELDIESTENTAYLVFHVPK